MQRTWASALAAASVAAATTVVLTAVPQVAGAAAVSVKVSPNSGLAGGQMVTVTGKNLVRSYRGSPQTWFVTECTASVRGHLKPSTDTSHCDVTSAKALRVSRNGTFSARYRITAGIIGDGYCGTPGHLTCVIGVGTAQGLGTVVRITFQSPPAATTTSTSTNH